MGAWVTTGLLLVCFLIVVVSAKVNSLLCRSLLVFKKAVLFQKEPFIQVPMVHPILIHDGQLHHYKCALKLHLNCSCGFGCGWIPSSEPRYTIDTPISMVTTE